MSKPVLETLTRHLDRVETKVSSCAFDAAGWEQQQEERTVRKRGKMAVAAVLVLVGCGPVMKEAVLAGRKRQAA